MQWSDIGYIAQIEQAQQPAPWDRQVFVKLLRISQRIQTHVLVVQEMVIGYVVGAVVKDYAHLYNITIGIDHARCGNGRYLLRWWLHQLQTQGVEQVVLEVRRSNEQAQALYCSEGFVFCGLRRGYYPRCDMYGVCEDALLMSKDL